MDWTRGGIDMDIPDKDLLAPGHRGCAGCGASIAVKLALNALGKNLSLIHI